MVAGAEEVEVSSYQNLPSYFENVVKDSPGSVAVVEVRFEVAVGNTAIFNAARAPKKSIFTTIIKPFKSVA